MKIPLSWLRDYVDLVLPEAELVDRLTIAGLEVVGTRVFGLPVPPGLRVKAEERGPVWDREKVVVAEITAVQPHPDADRLKLPTVTWGPGTSKQLVTGAPNVNPGDEGKKVVLAMTGAVLLDGHSEVRKFAELKPTKIRGIPSDAMVCSLLELGISEEHEGILYLEKDAPVGTPLADFMGDVVLEVDVLPNMARCLSMIGVAREVAAITGQKLRMPKTNLRAAGESILGKVEVRIENPDLSCRYAAGLIRDVALAPSPGWLQRRLLYAGMRPINNIVDITNFVMLEWGQPLHAFDYDVLVRRAGGRPPTITVRPARAGETLVTLDGQKRELSPDHLAIADTAGPIALAGVMGGAETEVTDATRNILLESAGFDFVSIRRTSRHFDLPSEASARFSRGIHPETVPAAAERALELMESHAGGTVCKGLVDCYPAPPAPQSVALDLKQVERLLGMDFPTEEAVRILTTLEFDVQRKGDVLQVTTPPHRLDIQEGPADLIEDLIRIHGYDRLPETLLADRLPRQRTNEPLVFEDRVRDVLVGCGLQEVVTYVLTETAREVPLVGVLPEDGYLRLRNPISSERSVLRRSLLASVLDVAAANLRHTDDVRLFEIGFVYLPKEGEDLPEEPRRLVLVLVGRREVESWSGTTGPCDELDFFDMKGIVEAAAADLHLPEIAFRPDVTPWLHPGRAAQVFSGASLLGRFGQLHPRTVQVYGFPPRPVLVAEFDLDAMQKAQPPRRTFRPVPRFPAALRDVAIVVPEDIAAERIEGEIRAAGGGLLRGLRLFDLYRGESIPPGTKSLAFALTYQADDRTLTDKEIDKAHRKIEDRLKHVLKAQIRGKEGG